MIGSTNALEGWRVVGRDGELGTLKDFYFDDQRWAIRYLIVHTGGWFRGRDVLLSPVFSGTANNWDGAFHIEVSRAQVERAPDIDMRKPVSRQLEAQYGRYYDYPPYWAYGVGGALWGWGPSPTTRIEPSVHQEMVEREMREREAASTAVRTRTCAAPGKSWATTSKRGMARSAISKICCSTRRAGRFVTS